MSKNTHETTFTTLDPETLETVGGGDSTERLQREIEHQVTKAFPSTFDVSAICGVAGRGVQDCDVRFTATFPAGGY